MAGEPTALMVELLYERPPELDAERLAAKVRETLPGTVAAGDDPGKPLLAHEDFPIELEDGRKAILTVVLAPDRDRAEAYDLSQSWSFDDAPAAVECAQTTRLVAEMLGRTAPPGDRVRAFKAALEAVVEQTRPLALWSSGASELVDPERLGEHALAGLVNVRLFRIENDEGVCVMDTLGLHVLGLPDFQLHFRELDTSAVARHLHNLAAYALDSGEVIESGHTVSAPSGDERWKVQLEDALVEPERLVLDIDPGPPYAAGGRG